MVLEYSWTDVNDTWDSISQSQEHILHYGKSQLENYLKKYFTSFILLSIDNSNIIYLFTMRLLFPL